MPAAPKINQQYTYEDYLTWPEGERWELIRGVPHCMTPAPRTRHQETSMNLAALLWSFLRDKPCAVFPAPFDVRLGTNDQADETADTVVQPDISVVCDSGKLDERGCQGPPDLVVEILSEETAGRDEVTKMKLYEKHGVREYWIVNPWDETVRIYNQSETGIYTFPVFRTRLQTARSTVLDGLEIDLDDVFPQT